MANFDLELESGYSMNPVKPITLSDGTVVKMKIISDGEKKTVSGKAEKDGKEVGLFRLNPDGNRLFMQVEPLDSVTVAVAADIIDAFLAGVRYLLKD